jgi:hypothetical protein
LVNAGRLCTAEPAAEKPVASTLLLLFACAAVPAAEPPGRHFKNDIEPLLGRCGCNSSGCHGKAEAQGGFKLSVFAFDPGADFAAIV